MLVYNWNFNPLTCETHQDGYNNVVVTVHWQYSAQSGSLNDADEFVPQYTAQNIGTQSFTFNPSAEEFIPFDQLTKEIVTDWVETAMGEDNIVQMQESLVRNIEDQITPRIVNLPAPWNISS
jgi:hypothetical protein